MCFLKMISKYIYIISLFDLVIFISRTLTYIRSKECVCVCLGGLFILMSITPLFNHRSQIRISINVQNREMVKYGTFTLYIM